MGRLTDRTTKSASVGRHGDGDGLHLVVADSGRRKWVLRYQSNGSRRDMGLGAYPAVSLADARAAAFEARRQLVRGTDPIAARRATKQLREPAPQFRDIAALVIAEAQAKSSNAKVRYQWERHLGAAYCAPLLDRPIHEITTTEVAAVLRPVWQSKPEVARKLYPAIRRVFEYARVRLRDKHGIEMKENPARWDDLKALGFAAPRQLSRGRHPSLVHAVLPTFMEDLRKMDTVAARALEFLILTNVRTDAVLNATWDQVDLDAATWTVPLRHLKDRNHRTEPFRVPLSRGACQILRQAAEARTSNFIFPGQRSTNPLSNMALVSVLRRMNSPSPRWIDPVDRRPAVPHGFRATFRTWAEETTSFPHAVIEQAMGHQVGSAVERAYRRTDVLERRRQLMNEWGALCSREPSRESEHAGA